MTRCSWRARGRDVGPPDTPYYTGDCLHFLCKCGPCTISTGSAQELIGKAEPLAPPQTCRPAPQETPRRPAHALKPERPGGGSPGWDPNPGPDMRRTGLASAPPER